MFGVEKYIYPKEVWMNLGSDRIKSGEVAIYCWGKNMKEEEKAKEHLLVPQSQNPANEQNLYIRKPQCGRYLQNGWGFKNSFPSEK